MIYDSRIGFLDLKDSSLKDKLESDEINKFIAYIKPLLNSAAGRNTINTDNHQFYFNKLLTSRGIKIQNIVLTKETVRAISINYTGYAAMAISLLLSIYNILKPDPTARAAAQVITRAGQLINRTNTLPSFAYGTESMLGDQGQRPLHNGERHYGNFSIYKYWAIQEGIWMKRLKL